MLDYSVLLYKEGRTPLKSTLLMRTCVLLMFKAQIKAY